MPGCANEEVESIPFTREEILKMVHNVTCGYIRIWSIPKAQLEEADDATGHCICDRVCASTYPCETGDEILFVFTKAELLAMLRRLGVDSSEVVL